MSVEQIVAVSTYHDGDADSVEPVELIEEFLRLVVDFFLRIRRNAIDSVACFSLRAARVKFQTNNYDLGPMSDPSTAKQLVEYERFANAIAK